MLRGFLERRRAAGATYSRIVYIGDGKGDLCPALDLLNNSGQPAAVLARSAYPDGVPCALWVKLRAGEEAAEGGRGAAGGEGAQHVIEWATPEELAAHLLQLGGVE